MIAFGEAMKSAVFQNQIKKYMRVAEEALPTSPYRVLKSYGLMLATSELVSNKFISLLLELMYVYYSWLCNYIAL